MKIENTKEKTTGHTEKNEWPGGEANEGEYRLRQAAGRCAYQDDPGPRYFPDVRRQRGRPSELPPVCPGVARRGRGLGKPGRRRRKSFLVGRLLGADLTRGRRLQRRRRDVGSQA